MINCTMIIKLYIFLQSIQLLNFSYKELKVRKLHNDIGDSTLWDIFHNKDN